MPRISNKKIGLKILEIMLEVGGVAGAFFSTKMSDNTYYLSYYSLFFLFTFSSYILLQKNVKSNFWIFLLNIGTSVSFGSIIGLPLAQFVVGPLSYFSGVFTLALVIFLFFILADSYRKK